MPTEVYTAQASSGTQYATTPAVVAGLDITEPDGDVAAVTALVSTDATDETLTFGWAWAQGAHLAGTGFEVAYRTPVGSGTWSDTSPEYGPATRSVTLTDLDPGTAYEIRVRAIHDGPPRVVSPFTTASASTAAAGAVQVPTAAAAVYAATGKKVTTTWTAPAAGPVPDTYEVQMWQVWDGETAKKSQVDQAAPPHVSTGVLDGVVFHRQVRSAAGTDRSAWTVDTTATSPAGTELRAPGDVRTKLPTSTGLTVTFTHGFGGPVPTTYEVSRQLATGGAWSAPVVVAHVAGPALYTQALAGLTASTAYNVRVIAKGAGLTDSPAAQSTGTTTA
jgi:hypothetical protein